MWFTVSGGVILGLTGVAKVFSPGGAVKLLSMGEPITGVRFKYMMLNATGAEVVIAAVCVFGRSPELKQLKLVLIAWLASNFMVYRLGLWWMRWKKPCGCLGNITDALGITPQTADHIVKVLLAYLLIGSYTILIWHWRTGRRHIDRTASERMAKEAL